jgi:CheY-like chemotaxis protein
MTEQKAGTNKKILIIDDERSVVTYLETLLQDNGYETVSAEDGRIGLEKAKREKPDLVCLDITMPEESGIRFYRNLKNDPQLGSTPVVIVTAVTGEDGDPEHIRKFLSTRKRLPAPEAFFSKPINRQEFLKTLVKILDA